MKLINLLMLCIILSLSFNKAEAANNYLDKWQGTYVYHGYGGQTAGGSPITLDITFTLTASGDCKIIREGYQRSDELTCLVNQNGGSINVLFKNYPGGKTENEFGVAVYKHGEKLFSLSPKAKTISLLTAWD